MDMRALLFDAAARSANYRSQMKDRSVVPSAEDIAKLEGLSSWPESPTDPASVLALLDELGSPATVASTSGRYFGFVTGGTLPAALAANWLAGTWDQNAGLSVGSPVGARLEEIVSGWLREIFELPVNCGCGFVTGATMANFTALAAARHALLKRAGWDVEEQGLFGAPGLTVVVGAEVHVSLLKALSLLGLGRSRVLRVATDAQGRIKVEELPPVDERTIVCIQAGNVNTGAFDDAAKVCARAHRKQAWVHVDGAFGLWAAAAPKRAHLMAGFAEADSLATDFHKWLNVPYDSGVAFVREEQPLRAAMTISAAYLQTGSVRDPTFYTPEASRRARAVEVWAALRSLGRTGLAEMIERNCRQATRFADGLQKAGYAILNEVVLNQVLVSFGDDATTQRVVSAVQKDGSCWCGGTHWHGKVAMRISVSCWATTDEDVEASLAAILRIAKEVGSVDVGHHAEAR